MTESPKSNRNAIYLLFVDPDQKRDQIEGEIHHFKSLDKFLFKKGYEVVKQKPFTPLPKTRQEHHNNLKKSEGVLLLYGSATREWVYSKEVELRKWVAFEQLEHPGNPVPSLKRYVVLLPSHLDRSNRTVPLEEEKVRKQEFLAEIGIPASEIIDAYGIHSDEQWEHQLASLLSLVDNPNAASAPADATNLWSGNSPYPGLRPFKAVLLKEPGSTAQIERLGDEPVFFGRENNIDDMVSILSNKELLTVVGGSGSGKSSLIECGLIPALHSGFMKSAGPYWKVAKVRPRKDPLGNLTRALEGVGVEVSVEGSKIKKGIVKAYKTARDPASKTTGYDLSDKYNLLVYVDRFEELFTQDNAGTQAHLDMMNTFVSLLLQHLNDPIRSIFVVFSIQADFMGEVAQVAQLPGPVNSSMYLVPELGDAEITNVVKGPLLSLGLDPDARFIAAMKEVKENDQTSLPVLQHTLDQAWRSWETQHQAMSIGDHMDSVIVALAEEVVWTTKKERKGKTEEEIEALELEKASTFFGVIFKTIANSYAVLRENKRQVTLSEIKGVLLKKGLKGNEKFIEQVIQRFSEDGVAFLSVVPDASNEFNVNPEIKSVELTQESVAGEWTQLKKWTEEETIRSATYEELITDEVRYKAARSKPDAPSKNRDYAIYLWLESKLAEGNKWQKRDDPHRVLAEIRNDPEFDAVNEYLKVSRKVDCQIRTEKMVVRGARGSGVIGIAGFRGVVVCHY